MPQPGVAAAGNSFLPYPQAAGNNFPPYPSSNFGNFPAYPGGAGPSSTTAGSYPPYMPQPDGYPPTTGAGYNNSYYNVCTLILIVKKRNINALNRKQPNQPSGGQTGTITEEHIKASLISAVEDKLRRRIHERVNQCQAEIQTLNRTKQELNEGRAKVNEIISKLEREEVK